MAKAKDKTPSKKSVSKEKKSPVSKIKDKNGLKSVEKVISKKTPKKIVKIKKTLPNNANNKFTSKFQKKLNQKEKLRKIEMMNEMAKAEQAAKEVQLPEIRKSDEIPIKTGKWRNKQRVLVFGSRGIIFRGRHLMDNIRRLLPHSKKESKMDKKDALPSINEICEMKNCNKCLFFEGRKQGDIYMWAANTPEGPSVKFLVENASTMEELKFTGNCLKGSRALLSFDKCFETDTHYKLMKEIFTQIFGTPYHHPKSQPFIDHVFTFTVLDNRIWFRNFQIMEEDGSIVEIGPRFILNPIAIFDGSFKGITLWKNPYYKSPGKYRSEVKKASAGKYLNKVHQKEIYAQKKPKTPTLKMDPLDEMFKL